jgi:adenosylcobinamide-GDP ribazoletransferase
MRHELRLCAVALQFLTRIPVPGRLLAGAPPGPVWDASWLNDCVRYFPLVGALVGLFGALLLAGAHALVPPAAAALIAVMGMIWLTGAFHEDGLADTFDGLGGSVSRVRALEIMKDSRIGTYGALALGTVTALRVLVLAALLVHGVLLTCAAIIMAHAVSRTASLVVMVSLPYAGDVEHAKAKPLATQVPARQLGWGLLVLAAVLLATAGGAWALDRLAPAWAVTAAALLGASAVVAALMRRWLRLRLGGYTGDTLGATQQLSEAFGLTAVLVGLRLLA